MPVVQNSLSVLVHVSLLLSVHLLTDESLVLWGFLSAVFSTLKYFNIQPFSTCSGRGEEYLWSEF